MSGKLGTNNTQVTKYTGLQVQTSALNLPIPLLWGKRRLSWNLIWQADFTPHSQNSGKGGGKGGGSKGSGSYTYTVAVIMGLCEGVVSSIGTVWQNQSTTTLSALGLTLFTGTGAQTAWSYLTAKHPSQALSYAHTAYLAASALALGSAPTLPQIDFEVIGNLSGSMPGTPDANLGDIVPDFLTNSIYGMGFSTSDINSNDLALFKSYQQAQGLFFSPALITQEKANDIIDRWARLSNSWIFWSGQYLKLVPLGDSALSANSATYTPVTTIQYNLTVNDFLGDPPVKVSRIDPADAANRTIIQITDRALGYNSNPIEFRDQTLFDQYGLRDSSTQQADEISTAAVGQIVADLIGQRAAYQRNTYTFTLPYKFILLEPGDLVTLTDPNNAALTALPVRIVTVQENADYNLDFTAEDYFGNATSGTPNSSTPQPSSPNTFNRLVAPGNVNTPCVLEPNSSLTGGPAEVWIAASGGVNWGGAQVYISFDNTTYTSIGTIIGDARQGVLTGTLASHADPDTVDTLSVDLTQSQGVLNPVTHADADAFRTLAYLTPPASSAVLPTTGELIAYGAVASTGTYADNLTYLRRGLYGTSPASHATNDLFTKLDIQANSSTLLRYQLPTQYIGATIYLKFVSFNIYGQAAQDISTVTAYTYTPGGKGYGGGTGGVPTTPATPSATPQAGYNVISWTANPTSDNVQLYQVWRAAGLGASFGSASKIGTTTGATYNDTTATLGAAYTYFIVAVNAVGSSSASAGANCTSSSASPAQPAIDALSWKPAVRAKTTAALAANTYANGTSGVGATLTATGNGAIAAIDGVTLALNDRLMVDQEATGSHNGIYVVTQVGDASHPYILTRATDSDTGAELVNATAKISEGTTFADQEWQCTTNATITVGTTALVFAQAGGAAATPASVSTQSGTSYTAALADANTYIRFTNASAVAFTIPPNSSVAFPINTIIEMCQAGAGALSIAAGAGVTINSRATDLTLAGQYSVAFVKKVATDTWDFNGDL